MGTARATLLPYPRLVASLLPSSSDWLRMPNYTAFRAGWLTINGVGQIGTGALLITYIFARRLSSQRNNPYLLNLLLTTFLSTIPPCVLAYSGNLSERVPPHSLCFIQSAFINGVFPMNATAQVALVVDTWSELRCIAKHKGHISRSPAIQYFLMAAPYFMFWAWSTVSLMTVKGDHGAIVSLLSFRAYCVSTTTEYNMLQTWIVYYLGGLEAIQLFLGAWVCLMIYRYPCKVSDDPHIFRTTIQFSIRVAVFTIVQLALVLPDAIIFSNSGTISTSPLKEAIEVLKPFQAVTVFLAFATQKSVLRPWMGRKDEPMRIDEPHSAEEDWGYSPRKAWT